MSKHEQQPGRVVEIALLIAGATIVSLLSLWERDPFKSPLPDGSGRICTPDIMRQRLQAQPLELPPQLFAPAEGAGPGEALK